MAKNPYDRDEIEKVLKDPKRIRKIFGFNTATFGFTTEMKKEFEEGMRLMGEAKALQEKQNIQAREERMKAMELEIERMQAKSEIRPTYRFDGASRVIVSAKRTTEEGMRQAADARDPRAHEERMKGLRLEIEKMQAKAENELPEIAPEGYLFVVYEEADKTEGRMASYPCAASRLLCTAKRAAVGKSVMGAPGRIELCELHMFDGYNYIKVGPLSLEAKRGALPLQHLHVRMYAKEIFLHIKEEALTPEELKVLDSLQRWEGIREEMKQVLVDAGYGEKEIERLRKGE